VKLQQTEELICETYGESIVFVVVRSDLNGLEILITSLGHPNKMENELKALLNKNSTQTKERA